MNECHRRQMSEHHILLSHVTPRALTSYIHLHTRTQENHSTSFRFSLRAVYVMCVWDYFCKCLIWSLFVSMHAGTVVRVYVRMCVCVCVRGCIYVRACSFLRGDFVLFEVSQHNFDVDVYSANGFREYSTTLLLLRIHRHTHTHTKSTSKPREKQRDREGETQSWVCKCVCLCVCAYEPSPSQRAYPCWQGVEYFRERNLANTHRDRRTHVLQLGKHITRAYTHHVQTQAHTHLYVL